MNKRALKVACVIKWKNESTGDPKEMLDIIIPNWLRVESAIIFFMSVSNKAARPAIKVVITDKISRRFIVNKLEDNIG